MSNTTMANLSPSAKAVLDALDDQFYELNSQHMAAVITALRAVVDQVVPETREHYPATVDERYRKVSAFNVRNQFFAIADELERAG